MRSTWLGTGGLLALVTGVISSTGLAGCAEERDPIDRTQPEIVEKAFFVGANLEDHKDDPEFRTKSYNISSAANTENYSGTIGGASAVDRIRWEITEGFLFGRRSYQEAPGADNRGLPRKEILDSKGNPTGKFEFPGKPTGTIIMAYRILSHFDVRRDYNPGTGEEGNTIVENQTDRPWNQRTKMRVDWSKNWAQSTSGDTSWVFGEGSDVTAIEYAPTSPTDEDRSRFEPEAGYFDVTNKYQLAPKVIEQFGVPECVIIGFFNGGSSFDCTPTEVKVRTSFVKLTGKESFESFEESFASRDIIGNWGNAGSSYNREYGAPPITQWDPQYGYTDAQTKTFFSMHNVWMNSHQPKVCGSNADADADGTADDCANEKTGYKGLSGSQCDTHVNRCTIPVRDREVRTIGYWLNPETPTELTDEVAKDGKTITRPGPIEEMTITWNQLMRNAVAVRREVECRRTRDGDRAACHALYFDGNGAADREMVAYGGWGIDKAKELAVDKKKPVIATCHNPVRAYDPASCGKPGEVIRLGDLRKNYTIYWPFASRAPYGGVGTIGADPLTGEMLGTTATIMGRSATAAAAQQRDIIQLALGDAKIEDFLQGAQATRYADVVKNGKVVGNVARTDAEIAAAVANVDHARVRDAVRVDALGLDGLDGLARSLRRAQLQAKNSMLQPSLAADDARVNGLLGQLAGSGLESNLGNRQILSLVAATKNASSAEKSRYADIQAFAMQEPGRIQDLFDRYQAFLGRRGICFHDSAQAAAAGSIYQPALAPYFKNKYGNLDAKARGVKIYDELLREAVKGIGFHEIGHAIGMRHNFSSSWDAQNYAPQYWQLRTNEGQSTASCKSARAPGSPDTCMGPRYLDPPTDDEQGLTPGEPRPGIEYFGNTSTMEYQIERFGETVGAGTYDLHTMKVLYGRVLETFDDAQIPFTAQQNFAVKTLSQGIPSNLVFDPAKGYGQHYTKAAVTAKVFDPGRDCRPATDAEKETAKWRIVHGKVCGQSPRNHLHYYDMKSSEIAFENSKGVSTPIGADGVRWKGNDENGKPLIRWHYRYGEDYSRGGYIHAKLFDSGGDVYEITNNVIRRFDLTYPWQYFRRLNKEFAWWSVPNSVAGTTFARLRAYHWNTTTDIGRSRPQDLTDDDQDRPAVLASAAMFDFLQRVILMPEPGPYGAGANTTRRTPTRAGALTIFDVQSEQEAANKATPPIGNLGIVDGRFVQIDFDNGRGGSWDYQHFPIHIGFDDEKVLALRELVDSRPTLSTISRENALDGRDPYISFRTDTPRAIDRLLGGMLSEDWETIGPSMGADKQTAVTFSLLESDSTKLVRPNGAAIMFPNMGYQNALGAGIYAMIFSRFSTDMVLAAKMRVRLECDAGAKIPDNRKIAFTDPATGFRYVATRFGEETIQNRLVETGVASRMLQRANEILLTTYDVKKDAGGKPILDAFGEPQLNLQGGAPVMTGNDFNLRRYVGLLDAMRQVGNLFAGGPLGNGQGGM